MQSAIFQYQHSEWIRHPQSSLQDEKAAQLVYCFAAKEILESALVFPMLKQKFPAADIICCSTSGEIFHDEVCDSSMVIAALHFDHTRVHTAAVNICNFNNSCDAAKALVNKLPAEDLSHLLVISDGSKVNGSELVKGLNEATKHQVPVTGGLAGDAAKFQSTLTGLNNAPSEGEIVIAGFYGNRLKVTYGSQGGWQIFGPERTVTKSTGNTLFELDHRNVLDLYKKYLGADANKLPGSALLFPLSVIIPGCDEAVVRTILSINQESNSMIFAGDIPEGAKVRFMRANFDKLTAAASNAALNTLSDEKRKPDFSLLVSCVGRKLILGSRTEEEVEAVSDIMENKTLLAGFYSYGEISPFNNGGHCQLHNQTMTITSFYEF